MNTALVMALDADGALMQRQRTLDEWSVIWALVAEWLKVEGVARVRVEHYDEADNCHDCFEVLPVD